MPASNRVLTDATGQSIDTSLQDIKSALQSIGGAVTPVVDNLTSTDTNKALSAKQGKVLNEKIEAIQTSVSDTEAFTMRQGKGDQVDFSLEGASVAWNQWMDVTNGSTYRSTKSVSNGVVTLTDARTTSNVNFGANFPSVKIPSGHKVLYGIRIKTISVTDFSKISMAIRNASYQNMSAKDITATGYYSGIWNLSADSADMTMYVVNNSAKTGTTDNIVFDEFNVIDLTALFANTTIADYIYNLEQSTSGSGVAWFRKYFPKLYYAFNAGTIQSVCVSARKVVGKNLCEGIENGTWTTATQSKSSSTNRARVKSVLNVFPSTKYTISAKILESKTIQVITVYYSGSGSGTFISESSWSTLPYTFTTPSDCRCLTFIFRTSNNDNNPENYIAEPQMEIGQTATSYEPYTESIYNMPPTQLRGLFTIVDGKLKANGDVLRADGSITRNYGYRAYQSGDESLANAITDGTNTVYKLTTPTSETTTPFQNPQRSYPDGTEEFVDGLTRDVIVPVGNNSTYTSNEVIEPLQDYVDGAVKHIYSTQEHVVGKWIDGSDIYEQTYEVPIATSLDYGINDIIYKPNIKLLGYEAFFEGVVSGVSLGKIYPIPYANGHDTAAITYNLNNNGYVNMRIGGDGFSSNYKILATLRYIKTS